MKIDELFFERTGKYALVEEKLNSVSKTSIAAFSVCCVLCSGIIV
jgi:hypothetical protein